MLSYKMDFNYCAIMPGFGTYTRMHACTDDGFCLRQFLGGHYLRPEEQGSVGVGEEGREGGREKERWINLLGVYTRYL